MVVKPLMVVRIFSNNANVPKGAFVAAPIGGLIWATGAFILRVSFLWALAKVKGHRFDAFDRPPPLGSADFIGGQDVQQDSEQHVEDSSARGKFF